jgi:hypothetical protein
MKNCILSALLELKEEKIPDEEGHVNIYGISSYFCEIFSVRSLDQVPLKLFVSISLFFLFCARIGYA